MWGHLSRVRGACHALAVVALTLSVAEACPRHTLTLSMESATPAALQTGLTQGIGAEYLHQFMGDREVKPTGDATRDDQEIARDRCVAGWRVLGGLYSSYRGLDEGSLGWRVEHDEVRFGADLALTYHTGKGEIGVGVGAGGVYVHEVQTRHQSARLMMSEQRLDDADVRYDGAQVLTEVSLKPLARLALIERGYGQWGLSSSGELSWRLSSAPLPDGAPQWGWGIQLGVYLAFGARSPQEESTP